MKILVELPEFLPDVLQESPQECEQEARMAMAVKLFEMKRISSGMAASMLGMDRVTFLLRAHHFNAPIIDQTSEELRTDLLNA